MKAHTSHTGDDWPEVKFWPEVFALFGKVSTFMWLLPLWFSGIVVFFLAFTSWWSFPIKTDSAETNSGRYHLCGDWWLWLWLLLSLKIYFSWKFFGKCKKPFWSCRTLEKALQITRIMVNQLITGILKCFQFNEQNAYLILNNHLIYSICHWMARECEIESQCVFQISIKIVHWFNRKSRHWTPFL